jgi:hypothetical protein
MKKIFTLALALLGFAGVANAASVDDVAVCKHSYVLCFDDWDGNGSAKPGKGQLFGNGFFLDVTGGSVATNKGKVNLSVVNEADDNHVTQYIADKYGADYPDDHFNSWRLKNAQDVIAMKVTAKSKLIFFLQGNNKSGKDARIPKISKSSDLSDPLNDAPDADFPTTDAGFRYEWTAPDDMTIYIGTYNGDTFFSFLIVEANEAPGTPTVKVGDQKFEGGLWFREVTCKANDMVEEGSTEKIPTVVTFTTDGTAPTAASTVYTGPIKCYKDMTVKFQAFMDLGDHTPSADLICDGADNEGNVNFKFDAPTITADGANVTITSPYAEQGGSNFYKLNGGDAVKGDAVTLTESATVNAYTEIANGEYGKFTSMPSTKDVYVLNPIKEKKTIAITSADVVVDEEATAASTDGSTVYKVENGAISADKMDFFVKNLTFNVLKDAKAQYQVPAGQEAYIQMSNTNIVFKVAAGDKVKVKVVCSKNSCKNLDADDAEDGSQVNDRKCYVNVSGTNYCLKDAEGNETNDLKLYPNANEFEFELAGGKDVSNTDEEGNVTTSFEPADTYYTFQKYSGTGNILISSIEITPATAAPAEEVIWANDGSRGTVDWGNVNYRFALEGRDALNECVAEIPQAAWDRMMNEPFYMLLTKDADWYQIRITNGWWDTEWNGGDIQPGSELLTDNGDGTFTLKVDLAPQTALVPTLLEKHLLFTGSGYTPKKLFFGNTTAIKGVELQKIENNAIFNLAGQRVDANYKGVVIMRGKKMILK